jgi:hypothetical protein
MEKSIASMGLPGKGALGASLPFAPQVNLNPCPMKSWKGSSV